MSPDLSMIAVATFVICYIFMYKYYKMVSADFVFHSALVLGQILIIILQRDVLCVHLLHRLSGAFIASQLQYKQNQIWPGV